MKRLLPFIIIVFLFACNNFADKNIPGKKESGNEIQKYGTVKEMLLAAGDYKEEEGRLKFIHDANKIPHIQVSNWVHEGTDDNEIKKQAERNIVYVAFQTFARTDIEEITITSIPLTKKDKEYLEDFAITTTVKRTTAKKILQKHLGIDTFEEIYGIELDGQYYPEAPNISFNKLQYLKLEAVFMELTK